MTENKRFRVTIGNENSVSFIDTQQNKRFLYIKFHTEKDAIDCKNALMCQCNLLNVLHEENQELRLLVDTLKEQNMKFKLRLKDLGVEYL
jgi:hypothetical protein